LINLHLLGLLFGTRRRLGTAKAREFGTVGTTFRENRIAAVMLIGDP